MYILLCIDIGLLAEKRQDYLTALEYYGTCNSQSKDTIRDLSNQFKEMSKIRKGFETDIEQYGHLLGRHMEEMTLVDQSMSYLKNVRGEALLRMAIVKKDLGGHGQALQMCNEMLDFASKGNAISNALKANVMCLQVCIVLFHYIFNIFFSTLTNVFFILLYIYTFLCYRD